MRFRFPVGTVVSFALMCCNAVGVHAAEVVDQDAVPTIGQVKVAPSTGQLQTTSVVTRNLSPDASVRQNNLRVSDALRTLPGVDQHGVTTSVGDDSYITIRGLKPSESQVLLDGHPIGPIGIGVSGADADGLIEGYNFQNAPLFGLGNVAVTFGSGATGLYGTDSVGGTIDMQTLNPSTHPEALVKAGFGDQGRLFTALQATGTRGKLGYALVHGVQGTYGLFPGNAIAQTGLRGTDFTTQTLQDITYPVSGAYVLRNSLGKLTYQISPVTKFAFTAYDATSWVDKTGEGDNDFNPYAYMLANAPVGENPGCPNGVLVAVDTGKQCISASRYAHAASGPAGGGPGAWQALRNQDYHGRLTTTAGKHQLVFDAFTDNYAFTYHRDASAENGPLGVFFDRWATQGFLVSDELFGPRNDMGFGYYTQRQTLTGNQSTPDGTALVGNTPASRIDNNVFVRDAFKVTPQLSLVLNAWYEKTNVDARGYFTPRLSTIYRPSPSDVVRVTAGQSVGEPGLQLGQVNVTPIGALNPGCGSIKSATPDSPAQINVGSGPSSNLRAEKSTDLEVAYGHRFSHDTDIGITLYDMNITDRIETGNLAAGSLFPAAAVSGILNRISQFCGVNPDPASVQYTLTQAFNAATARARGVEISGRVRTSPHLFFDYAYDIQSIVVNDLPNSVLVTDPTLVNGIQAFQVPLHKANVGIDFSTASGLEGRLDAHFVGINNPQQLPGYVYADASLNQIVSKDLSLNLGITNVFNSHSDTYAQVGLGIPYPTNPQNAALSEPFVQPFNTRYSLAPTSFTFSATLRI